MEIVDIIKMSSVALFILHPCLVYLGLQFWSDCQVISIDRNDSVCFTLPSYDNAFSLVCKVENVCLPASELS